MIKNVSEYIAEYDVCVTLEPMPMHIRALIKRAGEYDCIVVNDHLSDKEKRKAFEHELSIKQSKIVWPGRAACPASLVHSISRKRNACQGRRP